MKLVANCEALLFQRPDDAIHRGFDKQAEADIAGAGHVPLELRAADAWSRRRRLVDHVVEFDQYTAADEAAARRISSSAPATDYVVSSAHPRLVDGKPSKNPRYLQQRPDLVNPRDTLSGRDRRAAGPRDSRRPAGALSR